MSGTIGPSCATLGRMIGIPLLALGPRRARVLAPRRAAGRSAPRSGATRTERTASPGRSRTEGARRSPRPVAADRAPGQGRRARSTRDGRQDRQLRHSRPQIGLGKADLVTEELVEGGVTRLAVFYYQRPRSRRPGALHARHRHRHRPAAKAVLVASGGAPPTVRRVKAAGITTFTEGATGLPPRQRPARRRTTCSWTCRRWSKTVKAKDSVPPYLPFGPPRDCRGHSRRRGLTALFSGGHSSTWQFRGREVHQHQQLRRASGDRFRPDTVLVLRVRSATPATATRRATRSRRPSSPAPAGDDVPRRPRRARHLEQGRSTRRSSCRPGPGELEVPPGHIWIELVPADGGDVTITK